jgi:tRNA(Ile)-lysidine synthase
MGPSRPVADVRRAVRLCVESIAATQPSALVLAACSGGADSVALAAALAFEAPRAGLRAGAVTVDHRLQAGSAGRAAEVARTLTDLGLEPVVAVAVDVSGAGGPEAAARAARYGALESAATACGAVAVLLGHTLDDQAETVLLGLARGSGARSLAGMAETAGPGGLYRRPLLGIRRGTTQAACADAGLPVWNDPHNLDPAFTRVRVRSGLLPALEAELGPGVAEALARTAALVRDDGDALDDWAAHAFAELAKHTSGGIELAADELAGLPTAVRGRVVRLAALAAGATPGALSAVQLRAVDALLTDWHGQREVALPGGRSAFRRYGKLTLSGPANGEAGVGETN